MHNHTATHNGSWSVYIIQASDRRLYTGITNNIIRRWQIHCQKKGAKFFRGRSPYALCYQEPNHSRSSASQREHRIKQLSKQQKQQLIIQYYGPFNQPAIADYPNR